MRCGAIFLGTIRDAECGHGYACRRLVSSISFVEIIYLYEKERLSREALDRLETALRSGNTVLQVVDLTMDIVRFLSRVPREEVPDMPDRIIAATALYFEVPIISRDSQIRNSSIPTIW